MAVCQIAVLLDAAGKDHYACDHVWNLGGHGNAIQVCVRLALIGLAAQLAEFIDDKVSLDQTGEFDQNLKGRRMSDRYTSRPRRSLAESYLPFPSVIPPAGIPINQGIKDIGDRSAPVTTEHGC